VEIGLRVSAACTTMVHCERTAGWFEVGTRAVQTHGAKRGERVEPRILCCVQTEPPPRGTDAKTGWPALGPANAVLFHLLAVERMLEPQLLPYEKTIATKT
jgi:hypothetical protein